MLIVLGFDNRCVLIAFYIFKRIKDLAKRHCSNNDHISMHHNAISTKVVLVTLIGIPIGYMALLLALLLSHRQQST